MLCEPAAREGVEIPLITWIKDPTDRALEIRGYSMVWRERARTVSRCRTPGDYYIIEAALGVVIFYGWPRDFYNKGAAERKGR